MKNKIITLCTLLGLIAALSAFNYQQEEPRPTNLKVLPKNISHEELDKTMKSFNMALGVKCNHCHAPKANGEKGLDFASDAKQEKHIAREMIKMTNKINKKWFKHEYDGVIPNISCNTCHNGKTDAYTVIQGK